MSPAPPRSRRSYASRTGGDCRPRARSLRPHDRSGRIESCRFCVPTGRPVRGRRSPLGLITGAVLSTSGCPSTPATRSYSHPGTSQILCFSARRRYISSAPSPAGSGMGDQRAKPDQFHHGGSPGIRTLGSTGGGKRACETGLNVTPAADQTRRAAQAPARFTCGHRSCQRLEHPSRRLMRGLPPPASQEPPRTAGILAHREPSPARPGPLLGHMHRRGHLLHARQGRRPDRRRHPRPGLPAHHQRDRCQLSRRFVLGELGVVVRSCLDPGVQPPPPSGRCGSRGPRWCTRCGSGVTARHQGTRRQPARNEAGRKTPLGLPRQTLYTEAQGQPHRVGPHGLHAVRSASAHRPPPWLTGAPPLLPPVRRPLFQGGPGRIERVRTPIDAGLAAASVNLHTRPHVPTSIRIRRCPGLVAQERDNPRPARPLTSAAPHTRRLDSTISPRIPHGRTVHTHLHSQISLPGALRPPHSQGTQHIMAKASSAIDDSGSEGSARPVRRRATKPDAGDAPTKESSLSLIHI